MDKITFYFILLIFTYSFAEQGTSGTYDMNLLNVTNCGGDGPEQMHVVVNSKSYNNTSNIVNATVKLPKGFGDDMQMAVNVAEWKDNAWMEKIYSIKFKKMCSGAREIMKETFTQATQYLKIEDKCPIPSGTYVYKDYVITLQGNLRRAKYGIYKASFEAFKENTPTGCAEFVFSVIPKKNDNL